jgi:hypothetical protein
MAAAQQERTVPPCVDDGVPDNQRAAELLRLACGATYRHSDRAEARALAANPHLAGVGNRCGVRTNCDLRLVRLRQISNSTQDHRALHGSQQPTD